MGGTEPRSVEVPTELLAEAFGRLPVNPDPETADDYLDLIAAASEIEAQSRTLLQQTVGAARSAGVPWSAVGATLGMTRQAAQKRFAVAATPDASQLDPNERIISPVTAFDEMAELALAGRYGWHSVDFGPYFHRVVRSDTQWEHKRASMLRRRNRTTLENEGWQVIGTQFPFTYLKRDRGIPALIEPNP